MELLRNSTFDFIKPLTLSELEIPLTRLFLLNINDIGELGKNASKNTVFTQVADNQRSITK